LTTNRISHYQASLLGLAIGDALGTTLEFKRPGTFKPIEDIVGGGPFDLEPGQWTDDTSMALCLAESLIKCRIFDPVDQLSRYIRWYREGYLSSNGTCFDIGNTISKALHKYESTGEPFCGSTDPMSAGNGSIMRLAPVPLYYANNLEEAICYSGKSSETTHRSEECIDACKFMGGIIVGAVSGISKDELLSDHYCPKKDHWKENPLSTKIGEIASGSYKEKNPPDIKGSGYIVQSLEAALWAFYNSSSFKEGALLAVNLGHDADTTGAVYGQIAGAYYGMEGLPKEWVEKVCMREKIMEYGSKLNIGIVK